MTTSCNRAVLRSTHRRKNATDSRPPVPCTSVLLHKDVDNNLQQFACALDMTTTRVLSPIHLCLLSFPSCAPVSSRTLAMLPLVAPHFRSLPTPRLRGIRSCAHFGPKSTHKRALASLNPAVVSPSNLKKARPWMGSDEGGREGQGARTAFRKAPQASPPETRFTVEVNDFLERFKLLELGLSLYPWR